jgi:hypothetical protein
LSPQCRRIEQIDRTIESVTVARRCVHLQVPLPEFVDLFPDGGARHAKLAGKHLAGVRGTIRDPTK